MRMWGLWNSVSHMEEIMYHQLLMPAFKAVTMVYNVMTHKINLCVY